MRIKRGICILAALCVLIALVGQALAEGRPWTNAELPGPLPAGRPDAADDFYLSVNYDRYLSYGETGASGNAYQRIDGEIEKRVWNLVETGESTEAQILRILSGLIMDGERREREGMEPLMTPVRQVRATKTVEELSTLCRQEGFLFGTPYAMFQLEQSQKEPERFAMAVHLAEMIPLAEPSEDGSEMDELPLDTGRVEAELALLGYAPEEARRLTERIARLQAECWDSSGEDDGLDPEAMTADAIRIACAPVYDQMVSQGMIPENASEAAVFRTDELSAFRNLNRLYNDENLETFQAIVCVAMLRYARAYLDPVTFARTHELTGAPDLRTVAFEYMRDHTGILTEQAYADAYVSGEVLDMVRTLTEEYRQTMAERMEQCSWLSETSRRQAIEKARELRVFAMVPGERTDFSTLLTRLTEGTPNLLQAAVQYDLEEQKALLRLAGKPYDRGHRALQGSLSMLTANAVYEAPRNTFYVMAGLLHEDFYEADSREALLATIGFTIGHELGHGFDTNGIRHDARGAHQSILTEEDLSAYEKKALRLVEHLNGIELADGFHENGMRVINEAMADLLGLSLTLDLARKTEGFDYDRFFRTMAKTFCTRFASRKEAMNDYESNTHPAQYVRINYTFAQMDEFYSTYPAVTEGRIMYTAPEDRDRIW